MAITQAYCTSYKQDQLTGLMQTGDTYKAALFTSSATLDATTATYAATGESSGTGYTAGGVTLAGYTTGTTSGTAWASFTSPITYSTVTVTARGMLIYNSTRSSHALVVIDFGADISATAGNLTVTLPATGATALIRL